MTTLRAAREEDVPAIRDIFNYYVVNSTSTFYTEPLSLEDRLEWFRAHSPRHAVLVAVEGEEVVGWASLSKYKDRQAYANTVEISVYLRTGYHRRGIGRQLMAALIDHARRVGFHTIIAGACAEQTASLGLQASLGFQQVGHMREVGQKFGRWLDVIYTQLLLQTEADKPASNG